MKKRELISILLTAALITTMSGCSIDPPAPPEPFKTDSAEKTDVTDTEAVIDLPPDVDIKDLSGGISDPYSAIGILSGTLTGSIEEISEEEGEEIDGLIFEDRQHFLTSPPQTAAQVKIRRYDIYTCLAAKEKLSFPQAVFYDRLDEVCLDFLEEPSYGVVKQKERYLLRGVEYGDLGLGEAEAADVYLWFRYNNPQYYFLDNTAVSSAEAIYPAVAGFVMELDDIAKTTNEMFDKLNGYIKECSDSGANDWQKLRAINRKICQETAYDPKAANEDTEKIKEALGGKNQSIYSVLMTSETVSAGYAETFGAMANAMGIDSLTVFNSADVWNIVRLDNSFYIADICRNDRENGYGEGWLAAGAGYASINDLQKEHVCRTAFTKWCPDLADSSYYGEEELSAPDLKIAGSGGAGIKVQWEPVENADLYYVAAKDGSDYIVQKYTKDTYMYIPYARSSESLTVYVYAQGEKDGVVSVSPRAEAACSYKDAATKPQAPSNISSGFFGGQSGSVFEWDSSAAKDVLFCFGKDSTYSRLNYSYDCEKKIGFINSDFEEETYFAIASINEEEGGEVLSDPFRFSFSKSGGLKIISETDPSKAPESFKTDIVYTDSGRKAECAWNSVSGADGYELILSTDPDFSHIIGKEICSADETSAIVPISDKSSRLYFRVRAIMTGGKDIVYSDWLSADTVTGENTQIPPAKPNAPAKIWTALPKEQFVTFSWDKVWGADGYIFILYGDSDRSTIRAAYNFTDEKMTVGRFEDGETYYCGIQAVASQNGRDVYSDPYRFSFVYDIPKEVVSEDVEKPQNITMSFAADSVTFNWDKAEGASGYDYVVFSDLDYKEERTTVDASETSAVVSGFIVGEKYFFGIRTLIDKDGTDVYSPYAWFSFTFGG